MLGQTHLYTRFTHVLSLNARACRGVFECVLNDFVYSMQEQGYELDVCMMECLLMWHDLSGICLLNGLYLAI